MKIDALIVVYNKDCVNSQSLLATINHQDMFNNIIVFDNSTIKNNNQKFCKENNIIYFTESKNLGLSKAYNFVLNKINLSNDLYLMILDDDTKLTDEYFYEVEKEIMNNYDILLPIVVSKNQIISPANIQFNCRVKMIESINDINSNKITAINSGMVVKTEYYKMNRYNENIFLDYVDHEFMRTARINKCKIRVLNSKIYQSFSRNEKQDISSLKTRFHIYKKDFKVYCNKCNNIAFYYANILKFAISNSIKYNNLVFMLEVFRRGR